MGKFFFWFLIVILIVEGVFLFSKIGTHSDKIAKQFSPVDGSHIKIVELIKSAMKYPESFQTVGTTYSIGGNKLIVKTFYLENNIYIGGKKVYGSDQPKISIIEVSIDGKILKILQ
jgi:hypothetical protein